jgi:L-asparagine permease
VVATWATLVFCQMQLRKKALLGELERPAYRMPGAPWTGWLTLAFLVLIVVMMGFAGGAEQVAFYSIPAIAAVIAIGWWAVRRRNPQAHDDPTSAVSVGGQ